MLGRIVKGFFLTITTLLAVTVTTVLLTVVMFYQYIQKDIMSSEAVSIRLEALPVNLSSTIYYQDPDTGEYVEWVTLANTENRVWVDRYEIPSLLQKAFVAIEDQRYWTHSGIDVKRTLAAGVSALSGQSVFGGSTITQQLVKNLTGDRDVTIKRKLLEICRALKLEQSYSKEEILEWYMNIIYFGWGQYGVGTAAEYYFGKEVSSLTLAEACCIVGITNNPSLYDPYIFPDNTKARQELVLDKMVELGYISPSACRMAKAEKLSFRTHSARETSGTEAYPYYVDAVIDDVIDYFQVSTGVSQEQATVMLYYGGYDIYACVDMKIQQKMDAFYQDPSNIPKTRDGKALQSSMVILDPYTGDIVGLEGGVGEKTVARGLNWATGSLGRRPPGSSLKPVSTYAPALDRGLISPGTNFLDANTVRLKGTDWFPRNDSGKNYGKVSVRYGIIHSLNTIAAQVMDKLTPAVSYQFLTESLHMHLEAADEDYAPLAVGQLTVGVTAREMASAFSIFPAMGVYTQGRTFSHIYDSTGRLIYENVPITTQAISDKTAYWMTDILEDAVSYGTGTDAKLTNMPCAGKTGTTTDAKDRWFVGYTPYYVGAVWTGYAQPARIRVSGNPAASIWRQVMTTVHEGLEWKDFTTPEDISIPYVTNYIPNTTIPSEESLEDPKAEELSEETELPEDTESAENIKSAESTAEPLETLDAVLETPTEDLTPETLETSVETAPIEIPTETSTEETSPAATTGDLFAVSEEETSMGADIPTAVVAEPPANAGKDSQSGDPGWLGVSDGDAQTSATPQDTTFPSDTSSTETGAENAPSDIETPPEWIGAS